MWRGGPWSLGLGPAVPDAQTGDWSQNGTLGFEMSDVSMRMKWDNKYKTRGGVTLGMVLDEQKHYAIGAGFLTNQRAQEGYGQFQFVVPDLDPWSSFTLGEHVAQGTEYYLLNDRQVRTYTTYLNWFKRNPGRQGVNESLPPSLAAPLQTLMDNVSSLSGTATYGFSPMQRSGFEGSPRTNATDLSIRAVTPSVFGQYLPVSLGTGVNIAHYDHVDNTTQWKTVGNGGLGVAFLGGDYFGHSLSWLVGLGGDVDTRGVYGGTAAAEVGPFSVSYRQTSHKEQTLLASWRVSDLWTEDQKQRASTLSVANGNGPLNFASQPMPSSEDRMRDAEGALGKLGFLPPTGTETAKPTTREAAKAGMRLSAAAVAEQPRAVQTAIKKSQELTKEVKDKKNAEIAAKNNGSTTTTTTAETTAPAVNDTNPGFVNDGLNANSGADQQFQFTVTEANNLTIDPTKIVIRNGTTNALTGLTVSSIVSDVKVGAVHTVTVNAKTTGIAAFQDIKFETTAGAIKDGSGNDIGAGVVVCTGTGLN
ncbi:hypothetical protein MTBLM1_40374 [Rhodospirillaceae bacterium LM-1]|nr:hypothetical protein MTBLM1_40374 [Rhodospirillaceae bacterium LM-1]